MCGRRAVDSHGHLSAPHARGDKKNLMNENNPQRTAEEEFVSVAVYLWVACSQPVLQVIAYLGVRTRVTIKTVTGISATFS